MKAGGSTRPPRTEPGGALKAVPKPGLVGDSAANSGALARLGWQRRQRLQGSRRSFLRAVGAAFAGFPFLGSLEDSAVYAQAGLSPLKLIAVYHPHGVASPLFRLRAGESESEFDITYENCVLSPFDDAATYGESFKDRLLVIDGLDLAAAIEGGREGHEAPPCMLTGSTGNGTGAQNPSLDHFLAVGQRLGQATPFSNLILGVGQDAAESTTSMSFGSGGAPLPKLIDPSEVFSKVFASIVVGSSPEAEAEGLAKRAAGQSVLDFLHKDLERLNARLAAAEKYKLEQHLTSLRELEKQLAGFEGSCAVPSAPPTFSSIRSWNQGEPNFDAITNLMVDMLAQAVSCDLTRFGSLWLNDLSRGAVKDTGITAYTDQEDVHNNVAHQYDAPLQGAEGSPGTPESWLRLSYQNRYSYAKCARLLQKLSEGGALADSVVLITSDMGDTNRHSSRNVPTLLAGGAGGKFRMGRHLALKTNCPSEVSYCSGADETIIPNNRLLVSIANAFGVETDSFGTATDPNITSGALSELA